MDYSKFCIQLILLTQLLMRDILLMQSLQEITPYQYRVKCRMKLAYEMFLRSGEFLPMGQTDAGLLVWNGLKHNLPEGEY